MSEFAVVWVLRVLTFPVTAGISGAPLAEDAPNLQYKCIVLSCRSY